VPFSITILGSGAAIPLLTRYPTAHLVQVNNLVLLLDCGEGTQLQLRKFIPKPHRISHIFISHLHGDHFYGLIGLINTFHLLGRVKELHLYGIQALQEIIDLQLRHSNTILGYPLIFHPVDPDISEVIMEDKHVTVTTIPMNHRVPTCGFLIKEKPQKRKIRKDFLEKVKVPHTEFDRIKSGENYMDKSGVVHSNREMTDDPPPARAYAYCTDTAYSEEIIPVIRGADLLYHEATFAQDKQEDARAKFHSTAIEAASIAQKAGVKKLMIGHYSARYRDVNLLLKEAWTVFPNTFAAEDGMTVEL
jgi:ribonuclease Z